MRQLYIFAILLLSYYSNAQGSLKSADDYFRNSDFEKALQHLQILLNNPSQLKGDELPLAYVLRAKTQINLLDRAVKSNNQNDIDKYKDAYFLAFQDIKDARKLSMGEIALKETEAVTDYLYHSLRILGVNFLNKVYNEPNLNNNTKDVLLDEAQKYLNAVLSLKPDDYLANDFYAQVMMLKKADDPAMEFFNKSINHYIIKDKNKPDLEHFRVYGNMAILYMKRKNPAKAIETIQLGISKLNTTFQSVEIYSTDIEFVYKKMKSDLQGIEMDIYLNSPDLLSSALKKFQNLVFDSPEDYTLRIAYAQLLEQNKSYADAIDEYDAAIKIDSTNGLAWYNMGALKLNNALEEASKINSENNDGKTKEKIEILVKESVRPLKKALGIKPDDLECIDALMKVYSLLEMKEEYLFYRNLKTEKLKTLK